MPENLAPGFASQEELEGGGAVPQWGTGPEAPTPINSARKIPKPQFWAFLEKNFKNVSFCRQKLENCGFLLKKKGKLGIFVRESSIKITVDRLLAIRHHMLYNAHEGTPRRN